MARLDEVAVGPLPGVRPAAHRVHRLMLHHEKRRGAAAAGDLRVDPPLELPSLLEGDEAGAEAEVHTVHAITIAAVGSMAAMGRPSARRTAESYPQGAPDLAVRQVGRGPWQI